MTTGHTALSFTSVVWSGEAQKKTTGAYNLPSTLNSAGNTEQRMKSRVCSLWRTQGLIFSTSWNLFLWASTLVLEHVRYYRGCLHLYQHVCAPQCLERCTGDALQSTVTTMPNLAHNRGHTVLSGHLECCFPFSGQNKLSVSWNWNPLICFPFLLFRIVHVICTTWNKA